MDRYSSRTKAIRARAFKESSGDIQHHFVTTTPPSDVDSSYDQEYQTLFKNKGMRKAEQVLQFVDAEYRLWQSRSTLQSSSDEDWTSLRSSTAVVSIGGADGSELLALLKALSSCHGILVEVSSSAAAQARANGIAHVIEADVMDAAREVILTLIKLQQQGKISSVLFSCQSVLHELPTRSSKFTEEEFLNAYLTPLIASGFRTMFYAREPCPPLNWSCETDLIAIRLFNLHKNDVKDVSYHIANKLNIQRLDDLRSNLTDSEFPSNILATDHNDENGRVVLSVTLGQEVLFKLLYWKNIIHFEYEMGEQLTSFQPEIWSLLLKKIGMYTKISYLTTENFGNLYDCEETLLGEPIAVNVRNGNALPMPKCFAQIFSSNVSVDNT
ncbi:unnamed protein product [Rotaria sp. Silwood2]|nr:unnamed protein product [Rotaria sp. Silwood2]CAF2838970.1 unnamed protein product [Rotaria sp. Silwood2]CAF3246196.1 unnamed protein product [Rotaria sp. Silwood2]CAF3894294.1 unnamed protein product [Rotaria sp. Silwood2]CAF4081567.1 unnamed protein product [Rotaria sp. Silwood2]